MLLLRVLLLCSMSIVINAQTDWEYWSASKPSYTQQATENPAHENESEGITDRLASGAKSVYSFFISDLDGDNCPFHPTCSEFFVQSARQTNILKSVLMFTDRFTRDMNLGKSKGQYLLTTEGRFLDPVENYLMDYSSIHHIPLQNE